MIKLYVCKNATITTKILYLEIIMYYLIFVTVYIHDYPCNMMVTTARHY